MTEDRLYQEKASSAVEQGLDEGIHQQLLSMATGTGKTVVFTKLYERLKGRLPGQMLILAHREELIDQAITKMQAVNPNLKIDKEMAEHKADPSTAHVVVASVATLGRKGNTRLAKYNWDNFDKHICDEAHHSVADSYRNIFEHSHVLRDDYTGLLLGVTATPNRGDGKALAEIYKKVVFQYSLREAIDDGWLVDIRAIRVYTKTSLDSVKTVAGDFNQEMLAEAVGTPYRNKLIVNTWLAKGEGRRTIVFAVDIEHAKKLADEFNEAGCMAEAIWGDDPDRSEKIKMFKEGIIRVLVNCNVLTEGYDDWGIGCVILGRPTKSPVLFAQMVGRGTRTQDGTGNLKMALANGFVVKKDCIVIDVVDASQHHSLVTLPTLFGMSSDLNTNGMSMAWAVGIIEKAQALHPHIDFSNLKDLDKIDTFIEDVSLFTVKFPAEVEEMSNLTWHAAVDGGFILALNCKKPVLANLKFKLKQNMLDVWDISGRIYDVEYAGQRERLEEAFTAVEQLIAKKAPEALTLLNRKAAWFTKPASKEQLGLLQKFYKGKTPPPNLTKGQASALISNFIAKKGK